MSLPWHLSWQSQTRNSRFGSSFSLRPHFAFRGIEQQAAALRLSSKQGSQIAERAGRVDARHVAAARLAGSFFGNPAKSLHPALTALGIEAHDGTIDDERQDARRTQLGRLLHDQIQLFPLGKALREPHVGRAAMTLTARPQPQHAW